MKKHLRNVSASERGAFDLPSVMTAVIIAGIIIAVAGAAIYFVVPWSYEKDAKQRLANVAIAQEAYFNKTANTLAGSTYAPTLEELAAKDLNVQADNVTLTASATRKCYVATVISKNNKSFVVHNGETEPVEFITGTTPSGLTC